MIMRSDHPWEDFLRARKLAIEWLIKEMGYDVDKIANTLSMDATQVELIHMTEVEKIMTRSVDTINRCMVASHINKVVILGIVPKSMSKQHALELAAWLHVMAEVIEDDACPSFDECLLAIQNT
jgi:hypothetical protein